LIRSESHNAGKAQAAARAAEAAVTFAIEMDVLLQGKLIMHLFSCKSSKQ
jgi:hypothetical protein